MNKKLILILVVVSILFNSFVFAQSDVCGDGVISGSEQCDDGNLVNGDGCSSTCQIETGYTCSGQPSVCSLVPIFTDLVSVQNGALNANNLIVSNNVGIGTANPGGALHVDKSTDTSLSYAVKAEKGDNSGAYQYSVAGFWGGNSGSYKTFGALGAVVGGTKAGIFGKGTDNTGARVGYAGYFSGDIYASGNIGVGTAAPSAKLSIVDGSIDIVNPSNLDPQGIRTGGDADTGRIWAQYRNPPVGAPSLILADYDDPSRIVFRKTGTGTEATPQYESWIGMASVGENNDLAIMDGNVGIGTVTPSEKLEVAGKIKSTELCIGNDCKTEWPTGGGGFSGSGTTGALAKFTGANTIGDSIITESGTNVNIVGNVGIGTTGPEDKLHVKDGSIIVEGTGGNGRVVMKGTGTGGHQYEWYPDAMSSSLGPGYLGLFDRTLGEYDIVISPIGNVGIGTSTPVAKLHVVGNGVIGNSDAPTNALSYDLAFNKYSTIWGADNNEYYLGHNVYYSNGWKYRESDVGTGAILVNIGGGTFNVRTARDGVKDEAITWNQGIYQDSNGNVGIGTLTPSEKLDVAGTIKSIGFQLGTTASPGDILTADANGVGSWQSPQTSSLGNSIESSEITDGTIVNVDISPNAAIAGTKISPNFGNQNIITAGTVTAASFVGDGSGLTGIGGFGASGTPTIGKIAKFTGANTIGDSVIIESASGDVGIGTISPDVALHVKSTSTYADIKVESTAGKASLLLYAPTDDDARIGFYENNVQRWWIGNDGNDNDKFKIGTAGLGTADIFVIDAVGQVGIKTSPTAPLEVKSAGSPDDVITVQRNADTNTIISLRESGVQGGVIQVFDSTGNTDIQLNADGDSYLNGGDVGIGIGTPLSKFHIVGGSFIDASGNNHGIADTGVALTVDGGLNKDIARFRDVGGNQKITIDPLGNVGIGTVTPGAKLDITATDDITAGSHWYTIFKDAVSGTSRLALGYKSDGNSVESAFIKAGDNKNLVLGTTGSESALNILNDGSIGVGIGTPLAKLQIANSVVKTGTGVVLTATVNGEGQVYSSTTKFTTELHVGDIISIAGQVRKVTRIDSDLILTVDSPYNPDIFTPSTYTFQQPTVRIGEVVIYSRSLMVPGDVKINGDLKVDGPIVTIDNSCYESNYGTLTKCRNSLGTLRTICTCVGSIDYDTGFWTSGQWKPIV